ncbi:MAG: DUF1778 domain-containing protein [Actinobacteria bacterium]|nr:DUF1778 domain-containing protein [Actinomycetota bacterium]
MKDEEKQKHQSEIFKARFQPSHEELRSLAKGSAEFLAAASDEELGEFVINLSEEDHQWLKSKLESDPEPNPRLAELMRRKAPWGD